MVAIYVLSRSTILLVYVQYVVLGSHLHPVRIELS
jgi:hypothetical protein